MIIFCVLLSIQAAAQGLDMNILAKIESSGNPRAVNKTSKTPSYGLYQIAPVCLRAYNVAHSTKLTIDDLMDSATNGQIARWYIAEEIPRILRAHKKSPTTRNLLISYNAGVRYVVRGLPLPATTVRYIERYNAHRRKKLPPR